MLTGVCQMWPAARRDQVTGKLDALSFFFGILLPGSIFALQTVGFAFGLSPVGVVGIILLIFGLVLHIVFTLSVNPSGYAGSVDRKIDGSELTMSIMAGMFSFMAILAVNFSAGIFFPQASLAGEPITQTTNGLNIAAAEEVFFRLALQSILMYMTNVPLGIGINASLGVAFHSFRYGSNPAFLMIVFASWIVLGVAFYASKGRLSTTLLPHMLVNFASSGWTPPGFQNLSTIGGFVFA